MIPFFSFHVIRLGPVAIQVWGLFVALGLVAALLVAGREVRYRGLPIDILYDLAIYFLIPSFILARVFYILFYDKFFACTILFY